MPRQGAGVWGSVAAAVWLVGCRPSELSRSPPSLTVLDASERARLAELAARADANPTDASVLKASGLAHMRATLAGALDLQVRAEADLEAAFALTPDDALLTRSLGRFYNLRAVAGDTSKAAQQVDVYRAHLGDQAPEAMIISHFLAYAFSRLGLILSLKDRGRIAAALVELRRLEEQLEARSRARPGNVELHALAGNFALFFAGALPGGKRRRVRRAVVHFEQVRARWSDMRRGARHETLCPNTYENFMFELAEAHLALGEVERARALYGELMTPRDPVNPARQLVAEVSAERLAHADAYAGDMRLMPPWPSDVGNCVICHAGRGPVSVDSLYTRRRRRGRAPR